MYIHPHISTVTYLSHIGAPTMALNYRVNPFTGEYMLPSSNEGGPTKAEDVCAYLSWPKRGKHLSFDGRYLHAAPSNLMKDGEFEKQTKLTDNDVENSTAMDEGAKRRLLRRKRRVTFLVNCWINYKPFNVDMFPETMMDKMTKIEEDLPSILFGCDSKEAKEGENGGTDEEGENGAACPTIVQHHRGSSSEEEEYVHFQWSMGGCDSDESISMKLPLQKIQNEMERGGNIEMKWSCTSPEDQRGVRLLTEKKEVFDEAPDAKRQKME